MGVGECMLLIGWAGFVVPFSAYLTARLASYGWLKGREQFWQEFEETRSQKEGDEDGHA